MTIVVGEGASKRTFALHETLATKFSKFFAAAARNGWKESLEKKVSLAEESAELFAIFETFVYTGKVSITRADDVYIDAEGDECDREFSRLEQAWILGERLQAGAFKDAIVDCLIYKVRLSDIVPIVLAKGVYAKSSCRSPMKDLLVEMAIWEWDERAVAIAAREDTDRDFFVDMATRQAQLNDEGRQRPAPFSVGCTCRYHEHGDDEPCYKTMFF